MSEHAVVEHDIGIIQKFVKILESAKNISDKIFDVFPVAFILTDGQSKILKANKLAQDMLQQPEENMLGRYLEKLAPAAAGKVFREYYERASDRAELKTEFETRGLDKNGVEQFIFWQANNISNHQEFRMGLHIMVATDITELRRNHERIAAIEKDLEISKEVQNHLLPRQNEFENEAFHIIGYYRAADKVSGDWWWYETKESGKLHFLLGDVTGHGVGAAMVTSKIATAYSVGSRKAPQNTSMQELLADLNTSIFMLNDPVYSMSVFGAICDPALQQAEICFCGSNPVLLLDKSSGEAKTLLKRGGFIGEDANIVIGRDTIGFSSGQRLFAYTDGTFEFDDLEGRKFNIRRLHKLVKKYAAYDIKTAYHAIIEEIDNARNHDYADDMSFVIIDRK